MTGEKKETRSWTVCVSMFKWFVSLTCEIHLLEASFSSSLPFPSLFYPMLKFLPSLFICLYVHERPGYWAKSGQGSTLTLLTLT